MQMNKSNTLEQAVILHLSNRSGFSYKTISDSQSLKEIHFAADNLSRPSSRGSSEDERRRLRRYEHSVTSRCKENNNASIKEVKESRYSCKLPENIVHLME